MGQPHQFDVGQQRQGDAADCQREADHADGCSDPGVPLVLFRSADGAEKACQHQHVEAAVGGGGEKPVPARRHHADFAHEPMALQDAGLPVLEPQERGADGHHGDEGADGAQNVHHFLEAQQHGEAGQQAHDGGAQGFAEPVLLPDGGAGPCQHQDEGGEAEYCGKEIKIDAEESAAEVAEDVGVFFKLADAARFHEVHVYIDVEQHKKQDAQQAFQTKGCVELQRLLPCGKGSSDTKGNKGTAHEKDSFRAEIRPFHRTPRL